MKKKVNAFIDKFGEYDYRFGDYILFQEYKWVNQQYEVSRPILAIYLGSFPMDQTVGFNYVRWVNENRYTYHTEYPKVKVFNEVKEIEYHIEWSDYIDILGFWKHKPTWKEILAAYRKLNLSETEKQIE